MQRIPADNQRLDSWKEIAAYLNRDERTVKRWEKTRALPVHRLPGVRSGVFAFAREIDDWQKNGAAVPSPTVDSSGQPFEEDSQSDIAAQPSAGLDQHQAVLSATGRFPFQYFRDHAVVLSLSGFIVVGSLFSFTYRSAARNFLSRSPLKQSGASVQAPSTQVENLYLSGRYFLNKRTPSDLNTALGLFKQAVQRDPTYAPAYIGLADTYSLMVEFAALPPQEAYPPAIVAARQAIAFDPSLPEAHRSLAFTTFYWSWDRPQAEREFRKAIAIDPNNATTHHWFANVLMASERYQEALDEIDVARKLDPTAVSILADRGHILALAGQKQEARETLLQIEKDDPAFLPAHWYLAGTYYLDKDDRAYLDELRQIASLTHREADSEIYHTGERGYARNGHKGLSEALAATQLQLYRRKLVPAFGVAEALAWSGKRKEAIQYLKLAYLSRDTQFLVLKHQDVFPMLKDDPEFKELAEKSDQPYPEHAEVADVIDVGKFRP